MSPARQTKATREIPRLAALEAAATAAETLKAIAHPLRLQLVALLTAGPRTVNELAREAGHSQAIVSQQLRILRMARLVAAEPRGGFVVYRLVEPQLGRLVDCLERCVAPRFTAGGGL
ncbi:MAG: metalloregulator ArsR/SmtB family transcription factor [Myxococcota bacterium]